MTWIEGLLSFLGWSKKDKEHPQGSEEKQPTPAPERVEPSFGEETAPLAPPPTLYNAPPAPLPPPQPFASPYEKALNIIEQAIKDGVTELNLSYMQLTELPPEIGQLTNLATLSLWDNKLSTLPLEIGQLINLTELHLWDNQLGTLPPEIWQLTNLTELYLSGNELRTLPPKIGQLSNLRGLYLSQNQLSTLPPEIGQMTSLTILDLQENQLSRLPPEIGQLANLTELYLSDNQLSTLPPEIGQLANLTKLYLSGNQLSTLPPEIRQLTNLTYLDLQGNRLPIPPEILSRKDEPATILGYYFRGHLEPLNEAKLVFVGQGRVGKTSLVRRLVEDEFDEEEGITEGIAIKDWAVRIGEEQVRVNIWDFGGQEIMHATHEFFLTTRTLYVLVLDAQQDEAMNRLDYWLRLIECFGKRSPVIVVRNKVDLERRLDLQPEELRKRFPSINIKAFVDTSCKARRGMVELKSQITRLIDEMAHVRDLIPLEWLAIKSELAGMGRNYIPYGQFVALCQAKEIGEEKEQRVLIRLLHDLGAVLHFSDDPELSQTIVFSPEWVTGAVYKIINAKSLQKRGVLAIGQLGQILDAEVYPAERYLLIMEMMRRFERCFDLEGYVGQRFLIPDLLPTQEPLIDFWPSDSFDFEYRYDFLPSSILSRFMVQMHGFIYGDDYCWRTGVVLVRDRTNALVRQEERKISISVIGEARGRRQFLTEIRERFERIHRTISNLYAVQHVCYAGVRIPYRQLRQLRQKRIRYHAVSRQNGEPITVDVEELLDRFSREFSQQGDWEIKTLLRDFTRQLHPELSYDPAFSLGKSYYLAGKYSLARQALAVAHQVTQAWRGMEQADEAQVKLSRQSADLYGMLVDCCVVERNVGKAFEYAAVGKGRAFVNKLAEARFDFKEMGNQEGFGETLQQSRQLRHKIKEQPQATGARDDEQRGVLYQLLQQEIELWQQMERHYPALTATLTVPSLPAEEAQALARALGATLVEYYRHGPEGSPRWCAFVVTPDKIRHVPLPALKKRLLRSMIEWRNEVHVPAGQSPIRHKRLERLYKAAIAPLQLPNGRVIIAPFADLHLLPLAAAYNGHDECYLAEEGVLSFVPSLTALYVAAIPPLELGGARGGLELRGARGGLAIKRMLSVAYPGEKDSAHYLPSVLDEAQAIVKRLSEVAEVDKLHSQDATASKVLQKAADYNYDVIHFGCHGHFDSEQPTESGLILAGEALTVQRIITQLNLQQTRLVTLAACLSGEVALQKGEEHIGLLQGIMTAGAQSVVASLWRVDDAATHALFAAFYTREAQINAPAHAMRDAATLLRSKEKWSHPYYWAPFQVNGLTSPSRGNPSRLPNPSRTQREPTWPPDLLTQIEKDYQRSIQRGASVNEDKFVENAQVLFKDMLFEAPKETLSALKQDQMSNKMADLKLPNDELGLAEAIHHIVLDNPTLRDLFLPSERDVKQLRQQLQKQRDRVKPKHHKDDPFSPLQEDASTIPNDLPTVRSYIIGRLEERTQEPEEDNEPSSKSLWQRFVAIFRNRDWP